MMRRWIGSLAALLLLPIAAWSSSIEDIEVDVLIHPDGSASISQRWIAQVTEGTEAYFQVGNLGQMQLRQFRVTENGVIYTDLGENWDISASLAQKRQHSGILRHRDGLELCWGIGSLGEHIWHISYELSGLVQALDDADAFHFMFVNRGLAAIPEHARVIIRKEGGEGFSRENTQAWGFGFSGELSIENGQIRAESDGSLGAEGAIILLSRFDKGIFQPEVSRHITFSELQERAFEGSEYAESQEDRVLLGLILLSLLTGGAVLIGYAIALARGYKYRKSLFGVRKIEGWQREPPFGAYLPTAYYILCNSPRFWNIDPSKELIGAYFLRWILEGKVQVLPQSNKKQVNLSFQQTAVIEDPAEKELYEMARSASGSNLILEKNEFERWSTKNFTRLTHWPSRVKAEGNSIKRTQAEARKLIEFRNFLKDFTLSSEREVGEVKLWKDYLVFAQLFGIADKVSAQLKALYPAEFETYAQSCGIDINQMLYTIRMTNNISASAMNQATQKAIDAQARAGGGGHSSFGGGGGFSGGGFGGGFSGGFR